MSTKAIATRPGQPTKRVELTSEDIKQMDKDKKAYEDRKRLNGYKDIRKEAYGSWEDQLDMMYHSLKAGRGLDDWENHIGVIKARHPKP